MTKHDSKEADTMAALRKELADAEEAKEEIEDEGPTIGDPANSNLKNITMDTDESFELDANTSDEEVPEEFGDKLDEKSEGKEGPRKKNPDFVDMAQTGRWGAVSKLEVLIVTIMIVAIAVGITIALVIFLGDGDDGDVAKPPPLSKLLKPSQQMELIRKALDDHPVTKDAWDDWGDDVKTNPYRMAAAWIVEDDDLDREADILPRFALATIYYAMGGNTWTNSTNWLTNTPICEGWFGVDCDNQGNMVELDLGSNNLKGEIPVVLVLLEHLLALWFDNNHLEGQVSPTLFPAMPNLEFLYLQINNLTGPIPDTFLDNGEHLRKSHKKLAS